MILDFPHAFAADETERRVPDVAAANARLRGHEAPLEALLATLHERFAELLAEAADAALLERCTNALRLAYVRLALRHGRLGNDFHAYHNEGHILDICGSRIARLCDAQGLHALDLRSWCSLLLFGACHDLRQREATQNAAGVGANERASSEESQRILDVCGFSRADDADLYLASELTIAGSTFDARPQAGGYFYNAADLVQAGGALAGRLADTLDVQQPDWRADERVVRAQRLALIAADLDTANVAEPFDKFARSGENLCREREMLSGRSLAAGESALPVLAFLTDGQDRFFFELHHFQSDAGRATFEAGKQANAARLKALSIGVRARIALRGLPANGDEVIAAYRSTLADLVRTPQQELLGVHRE
ncbi:MAG: hypothetical protein ABW187_04080 [Dokdonella sp.]